MALINENYTKLPGGYLFSEIARKVNEFKASHPDVNVIRPVQGCNEAFGSGSHFCFAQSGRRNGRSFIIQVMSLEQGYDFLVNTICRKRL